MSHVDLHFVDMTLILTFSSYVNTLLPASVIPGAGDGNDPASAKAPNMHFKSIYRQPKKKMDAAEKRSCYKLGLAQV